MPDAAEPCIRLRVLAPSPLHGQQLTMQSSAVVVGRNPNCDLAIAEPGSVVVSGEHARIDQIAADHHTITDLGSTNGTWVNGIQITAPTRIDGHEVRFGASGPGLVIMALRDGTKALPDTVMMPAVPSRQSVGATTLKTAIATATAHERRRMLKLVSVITALIVLASGVAVAVALAASAQINRELVSERNERARLEERISELGTSLSSEAAEVARLQLALRQGQNTLATLSHDLDLGQAEREALVTTQQAELQAVQQALAEAQQAAAASAKTAQDAWAHILTERQHGLFLCVGTDPKTRRVAIGTAFAVSPDTVVTNAHVVRQLANLPVRFLIQNASGQTAVITDMAAHPDFTGPESPDIGAIRFQADTLDTPADLWPLLEDTAIAGVRMGTQVGTAGYPGELQKRYLGLVNREDRRFTGVVATFKTGWIGRLTTFGGEWHSHASAVLIQHSASLSGGTSGSPMFLADGRVVGVSNASLQAMTDAENREQVLSAAEIAFAIRSDLITRFLADTPFENHRVRTVSARANE